MKRQSNIAVVTSNSGAPRPQQPAKAKPQTKARPLAPASKLEMLVELMRAKSGATIDQLTKATGWQKHSVRGAISGALKKNGGFKITSERIDGVRVYRIAK
ncbi:MAG: DUF3489 domain-containing protein [Alphaproteobacteria bacterium]|nr:DUF3489 domain-containing protein [Alphaproteobacteria bacterium]